jgi:hypothetical protein
MQAPASFQAMQAAVESTSSFLRCHRTTIDGAELRRRLIAAGIIKPPAQAVDIGRGADRRDARRSKA